MAFVRPALLFVLLLAACPPTQTPRPAVAASLQLAVQQSCGRPALRYDTTCLAAVYVRVLDESRQKVFEECRVFAAGDRSADLGELLDGEPILSVSGLSAQNVVTFEVRGMHDVGAEGADPCANPASDDNWLFWGESAPVDLASYDNGQGPPVIRVVLECRDCTFTPGEGEGEGEGESERFGCAGIAVAGAVPPTTCEPELPFSYCVPVTTDVCEKLCSTDDDCFDGARRCVSGRCDFVERTLALCSPCAGPSDCVGELVCVKVPGKDAFCAPPCPAALPCPSGTMKCNRLDNDLELFP